MGPELVGAVVDGQGNVVARTVAEQLRIGEPASMAVREAVKRSRAGFYRGKTLEGIEVETVFTTMPQVGAWSVHLGIPSEVLNRPVRRSFLALGGGVGASLALAISLSMLVSRDLARQRRDQDRIAGMALKASEDRAALAIEAAEFGTWEWHTGTRTITGSDRTRSLLNLPRDIGMQSAWLERKFLGAIHPDSRINVVTAAQACLSSGRAFDIEFQLRGGSGVQWLRARGRAQRVGHDQEVAVFGIVADITPQKRVECERRGLLRQLEAAQEDMRRRIARELHDQVGQTVTGLSLGIKALEAAIGPTPLARGDQIRDQIRSLQSLAGEIGRDIHRVAADLRPTALDDLGLSRALSALAADLSRHSGLRIELRVLGECEMRLPSDIETVAYRVVQEALTNAIRHAQATEVTIVLEQRPRQLKILVEDDGVGFDAEAFPPLPGPLLDCTELRHHLGLSGMRERVSLLDGDLRIESGRGAGTAIFVRIPLDNQSLARAST